MLDNITAFVNSQDIFGDFAYFCRVAQVLGVIFMTSYEKFLKYCNEAGKSPSKVAIEAGCSRAMVSSWKIGRTKPTDATLSKIAQYFNVPMSAFDDDAPTKTEHLAPMSEGGVYWAERLSRLTASDQALLGTIVERLQDSPEATRAGIGLLLAAVQSVPQGL